MSPASAPEVDTSMNDPEANGLVIIQTAFPGDVILTGGLVRAIRGSWPQMPLAVVVRPDCEPLARMMDPGLTVITYDKRGSDRGLAGMGRLARQLAEGPWKAALLPHRSIRSAMLARAARLNPRIGFDVGIQQLAYTRAVPYRRGIHEVERNHDLFVVLVEEWEWDIDAQPPFISSSLHGPLLQVPKEGVEEAGAIFEALGGGDRLPPFAAMAPGSVWPTKRWPPEYWVVLASWLAETDIAIVWLGGEEDRDLCEQIAGAGGAGVVAAGALSWPGTAAVLSRAHVLVANDSAPVHLAGAVGCSTVAIFGPTVPGFGFGPLGRGSRAVGIRLGCRPCRLHGGRACPEGGFRCMRDLRPAHMFSAVVDTISANSQLTPT